MSQAGRTVVRSETSAALLWSSVGTVPVLWEPRTSAALKDLSGLANFFTIFPTGRADPTRALVAGGEASCALALASACPLQGRRQADLPARAGG